MTASLHRLTRVGPVLDEPPQDVVSLLSELLEAAQRGEIRGLGAFVVEGDGSVSQVWASGCAEAALMVAGAARLEHGIKKADYDAACPSPSNLR